MRGNLVDDEMIVETAERGEVGCSAYHHAAR